MTNDEYIVEAVNICCIGGHDRIQLLSGRAKYPHGWWQRYCVLLLLSMRAVGRGEAQRMVGRDRQLTIAAVEVGPTLEKPELLTLPDNADGDQEFRDRSTGLPLNPEMVKKARELEMQYMVRGWGDSLRPNYRSRLVCQETRGRSQVEGDDQC